MTAPADVPSFRTLPAMRLVIAKQTLLGGGSRRA
jgi:hypothetical protein